MADPTISTNLNIWAAHDEMAKDLAELEQVVQSNWPTESQTLLNQLDSLRTILAAHFRLEENGGYMATVLQRAPQLQKRVSKPLLQHRTIAESLDELIKAVHVGDFKTAAPSVRAELKSWLRHLREHESEENRLLVEVFNYDMSPED